MKKAAIIMIVIFAIFIGIISGYFIGRLSTDGTIRVSTEKTLRNDSIDPDELNEIGLININTADVQLLQELPGVGEATAKEIIEYRKNNGKFKQKKDLMKVKGIGEKTYEGLKDLITVQEDP